MNKTKFQNFLYPVLLGVFAAALLQSGAVHKLFKIKVMQLPYPLTVLRAFWENLGKIMPHAAVTMLPAIVGLILGAIIGYAVAVLVTALPNAGFGCLFLITLVNSVPIVALAPLTNRWFSNPTVAKLAVITIASSGAMAANAFHGLNTASGDTLDLMHSYAASKLTVFLKLRMPGSLPSVFTALKIGVSASMLATIISEFFSSKTSGLGYMIKYTLKVGNQKQIGWAYILAVSLFSILLYLAICLLEKKLTFWHTSQNK